MTGHFQPVTVRMVKQDWPLESCLEVNAVVRSLVPHHAMLRIEYDLLYARMASETLSSSTTLNASLLSRIQSAFQLAKLLEVIYEKFLNVPREVERLRQEQAFYCAILRPQDSQNKSSESQNMALFGVNQFVQEMTSTFNWSRLYTIRIRRLLLAIRPLTDDLSIYSRWIMGIDPWTRPLVAYVGWLFFLPRFLMNGIIMVKHLIPSPWMSKEEQSLGLKMRFKLQWDERWFLLCNDTAWFMVGLLNCFVLTGALSVAGLYLSVVLQAFDVVMASLQAYVTLSRLYELDKQYKDQQKDEPNGTMDEIKAQQACLKKRLFHEQRLCVLSITNASVILLAIALFIPALAIHPLVPVAGAAIAVLMTMASHSVGYWMRRKQPSHPPVSKIKNSFFSRERLDQSLADKLQQKKGL